MGDRKSVVIVSPALAQANNGNWHTAARWQGFLQEHFDTEIMLQWPGDSRQDFDAMMALHARRSAASISAWAQRFPDRPLVVVLTGTDLYRDIHHDTNAQKSLHLATRLVVLQDAGLEELPHAQRAKTTVVYQSCPRGASTAKALGFTALMVGHLRDEKDPLTYLRAAQQLGGRGDIAMRHVGNDDTARYATDIGQTTNANRNYHWLGGLPKEETLAHIAKAHVLVHPSKMEGGAQVILEAVQLGTPVLASRVSGNLGMLGANYAGYFEPGDAVALARLVAQCKDDANFLPLLHSQCQARAHLFEPSEEKRCVIDLLSPGKTPHERT